MSKPDNDSNVSLTSDMRSWSDGARGSTAIKAHADVIVCQERKTESDVETVYLGAFMKDGPDVEPISLIETGHESFYWQVSPNIPEKLRSPFEALRKAARLFHDKKDAAKVITTATGMSIATGYRRVDELLNRGLLVWQADQLLLKEAPAVPP